MFRKSLEIREHTAGVYHVQYYDGLIYSSAADRFLTRWDPKLGTQDKFAIRFDQSVFYFLIHNDELLAGTASGDLHFFDLKERKELKHFTNHKTAIFSMVLDEQNDHVFVGDADGNLTVWKWSTQQYRAELPMNCDKIRALRISDGKLYIGGADGYIYIMDPLTLNLIDRFYAHKDGVSALYTDGKAIYSGGKDAYIRKWNEPSLVKEKAIPAYNFAVYGLIGLNDQLISVSRDKTIKGFTKDLVPLFRISAKEGGHSHSVNRIAVMNNTQFITCSDDRRIIVWELD